MLHRLVLLVLLCTPVLANQGQDQATQQPDPNVFAQELINLVRDGIPPDLNNKEYLEYKLRLMARTLFELDRELNE